MVFGGGVDIIGIAAVAREGRNGADEVRAAGEDEESGAFAPDAALKHLTKEDPAALSGTGGFIGAEPAHAETFHVGGDGDPAGGVENGVVGGTGLNPPSEPEKLLFSRIRRAISAGECPQPSFGRPLQP